MEEGPDMDDLLDEMESDLIRKSRINQPPPLLPPTSIGMQPRNCFQQQIPAQKHFVSVSKFVPGPEMSEHMEGHINIDTSELPNTFQPRPLAHSELATPALINGNGVHRELENGNEPMKSEEQARASPEPEPVVENHKVKAPEPEPEEISESEEETLVPETQILDASVRIVITEPNALDTEMESMRAYLNGFDAEDAGESKLAEGEPKDETVPTLPETPALLDDEFYSDVTGDEAVAGYNSNEQLEHRKEGGMETVGETSEESIISQFADLLSEQVMTAVLSGKQLHYDPAVREFYESERSPREVFIMSLDESKASESELETDNYLSQPVKVFNLPTVAEQKEETSEEIVPLDEKEAENDAEIEQNEAFKNVEEENSEEFADPESDDTPELKGNNETFHSESTNDSLTTILEELGEVAAVINKVVPESTSVPPTIDDEESLQAESPSDIVEIPVIDAIEETRREESQVAFSVASNEPDEQSIQDEEEDESRPRFDSSIATIHMLHESDSEDQETPRRERRLTESERQLGKTCPYWIPDSECPNCMLCNVKFTILTRRHHCRACGRVLCSACCNEKALLDYLQESGKKPQAVRICKPCSSMLARIEATENEERTRRESIPSSEADVEEAQSSAPRGVLKTRSATIGNDDEGASTSSQSVPASAPGDSSRRSVMFRDGVRPGALADEENPQEEKSTALKPKKKSRKRTSVVKRIAELRMEDELACALPKDGQTKMLTVKPESEQPKFEDASSILETLCNFSVVTVVLKKNLNCTVQIFNNPNFGLSWAVSSQGFAQIGLDEVLFCWTLDEREKLKMEAEEPEFDEQVALSYVPLAVLRRISFIYTHSSDHEYAGVRRVESRLNRVHSVPNPEHPLPKHIMFFRPTVQVGLENIRIPTNPFLIACFLHDDELNWSTGLPNRLLYKLGEKYNVYPTPFVNEIGRAPVYSNDISGTVLKVFTDFRSWTYRMKHIPGCTVSLTNDKTVIRIPKSAINDLKDVLNFSRSMVAWSVDLNHDDDSVLICEETDPGLYSTQVFAKYIGQRESTSASFVVLDGGSKVNTLQVSVVEDGVAIRVQSERLETILNAMHDGHDVVETSKDMEFRVEFVEDGDWISPDNEYYPRSGIDGLFLMNKFQYGLSLERALTQVLQVQGISDYGVRMSHVYNLGEGRLQPDEEPRIYGMVEIAARECVAMLEPHMQYLIRAGISSVSIRLFVSQYEVEYDVSRWLGLEDENNKYKQSLDQLLPMLYNMVEYVPNGFEVEFVLSIVSTRAIPI